MVALRASASIPALSQDGKSWAPMMSEGDKPKVRGHSSQRRGTKVAHRKPWPGDSNLTVENDVLKLSL